MRPTSPCSGRPTRSPSKRRTLCWISPGEKYSRAVFSTAGGAANDLVMKLVRQYWGLKGQPARRVVVGLNGSYHGTMFGSHALSGDGLSQPIYGVDQRSIRHVPHDDGGARFAELLAREGQRIAAIVVEPVLGSGAYQLSAEFLSRLMRLREEHGFLLVADEVATGFYRTGPKFASDLWAAAPDLLVTSKALTNGTNAAAAVLVSELVSAAFTESGATFVHGETQAGSPQACAAIVATLRELDRLNIAHRAAWLSDRLDELLSELQTIPSVSGSTGAGCFRGVHLREADGAPLAPDAVSKVVRAIAASGVIVQPGPSCAQIIPALTFSEDDIAELRRALIYNLQALSNEV